MPFHRRSIPRRRPAEPGPRLPDESAHGPEPVGQNPAMQIPPGLRTEAISPARNQQGQLWSDQGYGRGEAGRQPACPSMTHAHRLLDECPSRVLRLTKERGPVLIGLSASPQMTLVKYLWKIG